MESIINRRTLEPWEDCIPRQILDILGILKILESLGSSENLRTVELLESLESLEPWEAWGNPREPGYNVKTLRNCKLYGSWKVEDFWETWEPLEFSRILGTLGSPREFMGAWTLRNPPEFLVRNSPEPWRVPEPWITGASWRHGAGVTQLYYCIRTLKASPIGEKTKKN